MVGKNVTRYLLKIPLEYGDIVQQKLTLDKLNQNQNINDLQKNNLNMITFLRINFIQQEVRQTYYNAIDLISELGGIGATLKLAIGGFGFIFII